MTCVAIAAMSIPLIGRGSQDGKFVIIRGANPTLPPPPTDPNTPSICPISCSVDAESGEIVLYFLDDIGYVSTTITAIGVGVVTSTMLDSSLGIVQLYIPVTPGFYEITFVTAGGDIYTGTFTL